MLAFPSCLLAQWAPPENPDLFDVLREAVADTDDGRSVTALEKYQWLFDHSLEIDQHWVGVRLSAVVSGWKRLADRYSPALDALEQVRARTEAELRGGRGTFELFMDLSAINTHLVREADTAALFAWLDANDPALAERVSDVAQPSLVRGRLYALAGKYIDGTDVSMLRELFQLDRERILQDASTSPRDTFARRHFINQAATIVGLLVQNDRLGEADQAIAAFSIDWQDPELSAALNSAREGVVPEPWP
jgi:hypothetical protein